MSTRLSDTVFEVVLHTSPHASPRINPPNANATCLTMRTVLSKARAWFSNVRARVATENPMSSIRLAIASMSAPCFTSTTPSVYSPGLGCAPAAFPVHHFVRCPRRDSARPVAGAGRSTSRT